MKAETETATNKSVRVQACVPLLCALLRGAEDDGSPGPGFESCWPGLTAGAGTLTGCVGEGHTGCRSQRMGPVGGLWLSRGDSNTGTLGGWGVHSEKPPHFLSGISASQSQPCWAVLLSFCVPPQGLCTGSSTCPAGLLTAAPTHLAFTPGHSTTQSCDCLPITLWPGGDSASVHQASWHRVGMGVRFPPMTSRAEGVG